MRQSRDAVGPAGALRMELDFARSLSGAGFDSFAHLGLARLRPKACENPGCSGGLPRADVRSRGNLDDELERSTALGTHRTNLIRKRGERIWPGKLNRE